MKIVSKYKDFYDSFGFILGKPDESVTYVRIPVYIDPKEEPEYNGVIKELNEYTYSETAGYNKDPYVAYLNTVVVGIYPYIYLCPFYIIVQRRTTGMIRDHTLFDIKPITMSEDDVKNDPEHIYEKVRKMEFQVLYMFINLHNRIGCITDGISMILRQVHGK